MYTVILKRFNIKVFISYLGIFPFVFSLLDLYLLNIFSVIFLKNFLIFYILIIFSFIGAMRWSFDENVSILKILYGFFPSLISTILVFFNLLDINKSFIYLVIIFFLTLQLICDFLYITTVQEKKYFFNARLPITIIILFNLSYWIVV